jgi:hypothetical protein
MGSAHDKYQGFEFYVEKSITKLFNLAAHLQFYSIQIQNEIVS